MLRIIAILLLCFIIVNLFIGLWHLLRDRSGSGSRKMVRALTIRVALTVVLFALIIITAHFGLFPS